MGFYLERIFPRLMTVACGAKANVKIRARVCADLAGDVVELGFGSGLNVPHYPPAVKRVRAIEPLQKAVAMAQPRIVASDIPIEIAGLDGQRLTLDDDSADAVLSTWTLCSIPDPVAALREVGRVLRPGGTFHFAEHGASDDPKVRRWQDRLTPLEKRVAGGCHFNRDIAGIITEAGLEITKLEIYDAPGDPKFAGHMYEGVARATS